jgi:hypothetical protein
LKENVSREKISSHLHLDFGGEGIFLIRFLHFEQVLQSCHHLMIMQSWNARIWRNIRNLKKNKTTDSKEFCENRALIARFQEKREIC